MAGAQSEARRSARHRGLHDERVRLFEAQIRRAYCGWDVPVFFPLSLLEGVVSRRFPEVRAEERLPAHAHL